MNLSRYWWMLIAATVSGRARRIRGARVRQRRAGSARGLHAFAEHRGRRARPARRSDRSAGGCRDRVVARLGDSRWLRHAGPAKWSAEAWWSRSARTSRSWAGSWPRRRPAAVSRSRSPRACAPSRSKSTRSVGVAGFVLPGTRVDVLATVMPGTDRTRTTTRIILQNVRALAADQRYQQDIEAAEPQYVTVVTLLVTPDQAESPHARRDPRGGFSSRSGTRSTPKRSRRPDAGSRSSCRPPSGSSPRPTPAAVQAAPVNQEQVIESFEGGNRTLLKFGRGGGGR